MDTDVEKRRKLRSRILKKRDGLSLEDRRGKSELIREKLWQLDAIKHAEVLFIYVNFRSEVETLPLIEQCLALGKTVAVPLTVTDGFQLIPYRLIDSARDLIPGYCGILEPDPERVVKIEPGQIETVVLPGSVFDLHGGRLGYGGGYYDRFLQNAAPRACRIGVAFAEQVVSRVPVQAHDQSLHILVTEKDIHYCDSKIG